MNNKEENDIRFDQDEEWLSSIIEEFQDLGDLDTLNLKYDELTLDTKQPFHKRWPRIIKLLMQQKYGVKFEN